MRDEILASIELEEASETKFNPLDLLWDRSDIRAGRRIRVAFLVLAIQQLMGINLSVYYSTVLFSQVGLSPFLSSLLAAVMNTAFALGTMPLAWGPINIERVGRRPVMLWSAVILTLCLLIFTTMTNLPNVSTATQWTAVAFINVYNLVFGYGWIGVPWLYGPEVSSSRFCLGPSSD
jgi:MFS family permease